MVGSRLPGTVPWARGARGPARGGTAKALASAGLIGLVSGLRSQSGVAAVALTTDSSATGRPGSLLAGRKATAVSVTAALGELVGDKLPRTPSRLAPGGLLPRLALGAFAATLLAARERPGAPALPLLPAAAIGATAAFAGARAGARWRQAAADRGLPDWPAALLEDAATLALAWAACSALSG
ncbi:hypothetical protein [Streptomyces sp. NBC_01190]|uniref:hypothetical protein n=1 Tax=Streptomyces sp. NBC_01190 TaxID=2903767 RepID=UPI003864829C|nr:hypothetical protein OG519_33415 [Streptomyces sp. NBC_01190]